jgi:hypothetical protein
MIAFLEALSILAAGVAAGVTWISYPEVWA